MAGRDPEYVALQTRAEKEAFRLAWISAHYKQVVATSKEVTAKEEDMASAKSWMTMQQLTEHYHSSEHAENQVKKCRELGLVQWNQFANTR